MGPAGRDAGSGDGAPPYGRHRPERTRLYQLVEAYYPAFKAHLAAQGMGINSAYVGNRRTLSRF